MLLLRSVRPRSLCRPGAYLSFQTPKLIFIRKMATTTINGDLNNTAAERARIEITVDPAYHGRSLAIPYSQDDSTIRQSYRPFLLDDETTSSDWISQLELSTALKMVETQILNRGEERLKILVLHGSMRSRSYSRLLAYEASRILFRLGCDVRMYDPTGLPVKDDVQHSHPKVQELRELSKWSDGHMWISPEQHGNLVSVSLPFSLNTVNDNTSDCGLQKPNRLDPTINRLSSTNSRTHPGNCTSFRWIAVLQYCQLAANPRAMDAHVYNTKPKQYPYGVQTVYRRG